MPENMEIGTQNGQENSEKSENIQQNSEINPELNDNVPEDDAGDPEGSETPSENGEEGDDLPLPEPDVSDEEVKKKKEMPEWMKKKIEREKASAERKEQEALALKQENERLRQIALQGQNPDQKLPQTGLPNDPNLPRRDQFATDEEYFFAVADYRDAVRQHTYMQKQREENFQKAEKGYQDGLKSTVDEGREKYKDFDERVDYILYGDGFPSNRAMGEAIVESPYKSDILYFLGTHVKEAERIAKLNPVAAIREISKLEHRFEAKKRSPLTKAPKPLSPLGGGKGSATHKDPSKMEMDEFTNWYNDTYR